NNIVSTRRHRVPVNRYGMVDLRDVGLYVCAVGLTVADVLGIIEPKSYKEAMASAHSAQWKAAAQLECDSLQSQEVWALVDPRSGASSMGGWWVFVAKLASDGTVLEYKARFCAQGFTQIEGEDYTDTYAPVMKYDTLRILL